MSAREPFMPSRPASRTSHPADSHSVEQTEPRSSTPKDFNAYSQSDDPVTVGIDTNKPLNISSLSRRMSSISQSHSHQKKQKNPLQMVQSLANTLSPAPNHPRLINHHQLNIAQPRPSPPSAFLESVSITEFKVPNVPSSKLVTRPPSAAPLSNNDAHTSTEKAFSSRPTSPLSGFSTSIIAHPGSIAASSNKFRPRASNALSLSTSLEKIIETAEDQEQQEEQGSDLQPRAHIPFGNDGPRRVMAPVDGSEEVNLGAGGAPRALRRRSKRDRSLRREEEEEEEYGPAKRWKGVNGNPMVVDDQSYSRSDDHRSNHPEQQLHHYQSVNQLDQRPLSNTSRRLSASRQETSQHLIRTGPLETSPANFMRDFLGRDLDMYVDAHVDKYVGELKKWEACEMEEWAGGANVLAEKFGNVLDFVKDHMTTKINLWATIDSELASHTRILNERRFLLSEVQKNLVKDSGAVLDGGGGINV